MNENKIFIKNRYGNKLCGVLNIISDDESMTIICHARGSHKDSRATLNISKTLTENNINNFRFDFTSDGESEGNELDVNDTKLCEDLESVIEYFTKKGYKDFILIGASLGGRIISLIDTDKYNVKKMIMWYPAIIYKNIFKRIKNKLFRKKEEKIALKEGYFLMHDRKKMSLEYLEQERKMDYYKKAISISVPVLIIQGSGDPFADYHNAIKISQNNKNAKLILIENENHGFKKDDKNLKYACDETLQFIKDKM